MEIEGHEKSLLAYLFLVADEKLTAAKLEMFNELLTGNDELDAKRNDLILECRKLSGEDFNKFSGDRRSKLVFKAVKILEEEIYPYGEDNPTVTQLEYLWILINLGCFSDISKNQDMILKWLIKKWNVPNLVQIEMRDTAETLVDIENYRKWLMKPKRKYSRRYTRKIVAELDKNELDINQSIAYLVHDSAQDTGCDAEDEDDNTDDDENTGDDENRSKLAMLIEAIEEPFGLEHKKTFWRFAAKLLDINIHECKTEVEVKQTVKDALDEGREDNSFFENVKIALFCRGVYALIRAVLFILYIPIRLFRLLILIKNAVVSFFCHTRKNKSKSNPYDYSLQLEEVEEEDDDADESWG
jgi:hypothetical protein